MRIFNSFFMGGFECADHINRSGERINLLHETQHDSRATEDYQLLRQVGIGTVREGLCWSNVEKEPFVYDFTEVEARMKAAAQLDIQQIWDLCHFGYPDGLYPTHPHFCERFRGLCKAFADFYRLHAAQQLFVVPINEISFLSWHSGDMRGTVPFAVNCGFDIKYHLCKAAIVGIRALREAIPSCRIILVEPLIKVHAGTSSDSDALFRVNEDQFQAMDIIAGRMCPELGGREDYLDILGFNYYWDCQWLHHGPPLPWPPVQTLGQPCRVPLRGLLALVRDRYNRPFLLAETGHFGSGRAQWLDEVATECNAALAAGADLLGICIYPVIDRPDWDDPARFHNSGLWDLDAARNRIADTDALRALQTCMARIPPAFASRG